MLDLSHLPQAGGVRMDVYVGRTDPYIWNKPRNCSFVYLLAIGSGGGGAGGNHVATGASAGGGGGASGGVGRILIPAIFLPDAISIVVGVGGAGGNSASNGTAGTATHLYFQPGATGNRTLGHGGTVWANGGLAGLTAGSGGSGPTANLPDIGYLLTAGVATASNGSSGRTSTNTNVQPNPLGWTGLTMGGGGGAGFASAFAATQGGNITYFSKNTLSTVNQTLAGGAGGNGVAGGDGQHGFSTIPSVSSPYDWLCTPGAGGGNSTVAGGRGGNGGYGCGGGGGGARQGAASGGGAGGRGGEGLVMVWSF